MKINRKEYRKRVGYYIEKSIVNEMKKQNLNNSDDFNGLIIRAESRVDIEKRINKVVQLNHKILKNISEIENYLKELTKLISLYYIDVLIDYDDLIKNISKERIIKEDKNFWVTNQKSFVLNNLNNEVGNKIKKNYNIEKNLYKKLMKNNKNNSKEINKLLLIGLQNMEDSNNISSLHVSLNMIDTRVIQIRNICKLLCETLEYLLD